jgi:hypothetical protein
MRGRQVDDTEVINFLLSTEIIPLCLRTMEMGSELSKTVATFIVQKILLDNVRASILALSCPTQYPSSFCTGVLSGYTCNGAL